MPNERIDQYKISLWDIDIPINVPGGIYFTNIEPGDFRVELKDGKEPICCAFLCPCGCGSYVSLSLQGSQDKHPYLWNLQDAQAEAPTLTPSVNSIGMPCKSHYWIRNGRVDWCK